MLCVAAELCDVKPAYTREEENKNNGGMWFMNDTRTRDYSEFELIFDLAALSSLSHDD